MVIDKALLDQLLAGREPQELFAKGGLIDDLKKALSERMLAAELEDHLEAEAEAGLGNRRNGSSKRTMLTGSSTWTLDIPCEWCEAKTQFAILFGDRFVI